LRRTCAEVEARVGSLASRLEGDDISLQDYLGIVGQDEETFIATTKDQAEHALSTRVLLESIGKIENFEITDDDIRLHIEAMLQGEPADVDELVEAWKSSGQIESLTSDILRDKAMASLIDSATPVDSAGDVVDLTPVVIDTPDEGTSEDESADEADDESEVPDTQDETTEQSEEEK
jgi:trigger factor